MMPPSYSKKYRKLSIAGSKRDVFPPWKRIPIGFPVINDVNTENIHTSNITWTELVIIGKINVYIYIYTCMQ